MASPLQHPYGWTTCSCGVLRLVRSVRRGRGVWAAAWTLALDGTTHCSLGPSALRLPLARSWARVWRLGRVWLCMRPLGLRRPCGYVRWRSSLVTPNSKSVMTNRVSYRKTATTTATGLDVLGSSTTSTTVLLLSTTEPKRAI